MKTEHVKADLHTHGRTTNRFREGDFNKIVDAAYRNMGEGCVVGIVNVGIQSAWNFERIIDLKGYDRITLENSVYVPEKDVLIIKTQQVPTNQGHYLAIGVPAGIKLKQYKNLENSLDEAYGLGVDVIKVADPFLRFQGIGKYILQNPGLLEKFDGVGIYNGESETHIPFLNPKHSNQQAEEFFNEVKWKYPHLFGTVISDGHSFYEIGSSWIKIKSPKIGDAKTMNNSLKENLKHPRAIHRGKSNWGAIKHTSKLATIIALNKLGIEIDDDKYLSYEKKFSQ
ncbi:MAG: hypothetical protein Q8P15_02350 [Nanoarchaeota archaeon]|nr:hypothetical protein [Nanoarchaeota archaeon]